MRLTMEVRDFAKSNLVYNCSYSTEVEEQELYAVPQWESETIPAAIESMIQMSIARTALDTEVAGILTDEVPGRTR